MEDPFPNSLSENELDRFRAIKDVQVVIDVGARTSLDYLAIHPDAEYHLFEPNPQFYEYLWHKTKNLPNVTINAYALGDTEGLKGYDSYLQAMDGAERTLKNTNAEYPMRKLDSYIEENNITRIDYLKVDAEGYDYKILAAAPNAVKMARYIQFEHWNNQEAFFSLLGNEFDMEDIGGRNYFCTRKV